MPAAATSAAQFLMIGSCVFLIASLTSWARPLGANGGWGAGLPPHDNKGAEVMQRVKQLVQIEKRMGSRPPMCSNKCNACNPCEAVQMPTPLAGKTRPRANGVNTMTPSALFHLDYSNYQPEGWKCRCGSLIFNP